MQDALTILQVQACRYSIAVISLTWSHSLRLVVRCLISQTSPFSCSHNSKCEGSYEGCLPQETMKTLSALTEVIDACMVHAQPGRYKLAGTASQSEQPLQGLLTTRHNEDIVNSLLIERVASSEGHVLIQV